MVESVTQASFEHEVLEASAQLPVLVDFWAPWCGPCRALAPVLEQLESELAGKLKVVKLNTDEAPELATRYAIRSIPAVKLFRNGAVAAEFVGAQPLGAVRAFLDPHLPRASADAHAAALALAESGDVAGGIAALEAVRAADPANLEAALDLAHWQALAGRHADAEATLDALAPAAQADGPVKATRAYVHFSRLAGEPLDSPRHAAARLMLEGRAAEALEGLFEWLRADRRAALADGRADVLKVFELLGESHELVGAARRRLAALIN